MVDDEPDAAISIKIALEESGDFEVDTFNDAESALFACPERMAFSYVENREK